MLTRPLNCKVSQSAGFGATCYSGRRRLTRLVPVGTYSGYHVHDRTSFLLPLPLRLRGTSQTCDAAFVRAKGPSYVRLSDGTDTDPLTARRRFSIRERFAISQPCAREALPNATCV